MTGRTPFSELRARMSPASQARATAKSGLLEQEMALAELRRAIMGPLFDFIQTHPSSTSAFAASGLASLSFI